MQTMTTICTITTYIRFLLLHELQGLLVFNMITCMGKPGYVEETVQGTQIIVFFNDLYIYCIKLFILYIKTQYHTEIPFFFQQEQYTNWAIILFFAIIFKGT